ncbi:TlpA family protein disulfide reductase [Lewinella sp. 4G2]|uniref:TlpA family protein disulfide reductase n=1 Tax=Lewinella sp. 4G2 TaxID=1803372 RepID=UPI0007B47A5B|nr:TlpA family protein disulfide reductase [Lewinella sp. 4G2]OAV45646.1 DUF5106 domain-containing protein [Lewinella sp. 4G2]
MRLLSLLFALCVLVSCGDAAVASSNSTATSGNAAQSAPQEVDLSNAEAPNIRIILENTPIKGALLVGQFMDQQFRVDSASVEGNTMVFQRDDPYNPGHYLVYLPTGNGIQIMISDDQTFTMSGDMSNLAATAKIEGQDDTKLLYEAMAYEQSLQSEFQALSNRRSGLRAGTPEYDAAAADRRALVAKRQAKLEEIFAKAPNSLFTTFKRAGQNPNLKDLRLPNGDPDEVAQVADFRYHFWDGVDFSDARLLRTPVIKTKLNRYIKELTPQNADSIIVAADRLLAKTGYQGKFFEFFANWITLQYEPGKSTVMDAEAIHVNMIQKYFTKERATWSDSMTVYGLQQRASTMAQSLIGLPAPDITVPGLDGQGKRLYDLKKPYIAVFMFNPECEHCIEQAPKLTALYPSLRNELDIYAIALDTEPEKWKNFVKAYNFTPFTNVFDPTNRSIFKTFYVDNTPELYLIDADRKIVAKNLKVSQLAEAIQMDKVK